MLLSVQAFEWYRQKGVIRQNEAAPNGQNYQLSEALKNEFLTGYRFLPLMVALSEIR